MTWHADVRRRADRRRQRQDCRARRDRAARAHCDPGPGDLAGTPDVMTQPPEAATRAAAFGGVTTVVDFAGGLSLTPDPDAPRMPIAQASSSDATYSVATRTRNFTFHYILAGEVVPETIGQIGEAIQDGVASFKIFTTFRPIRVPYGHLSRIFEEVAKHGGIMAVHAEEDDVVTYMTETLKREGRAQAITCTWSTTISPRTLRSVTSSASPGTPAARSTSCTRRRRKESPRSPRRARPDSPCTAKRCTTISSSRARTTKKPGGTAIHTTPRSSSPTTVTRSSPLDGRPPRHDRDRRVHDAQGLQARRRHDRDRVRGHNGIETRMPVAFKKFVSSAACR